MARYRGADGKVYNFKTGPGATKLPDPPGTNKSGAQSLGSKTNDNAITLDQAVGIVNQLTGGGGGRLGLGTRVLKYPLDGQNDFPAVMRFTVHKVDAYTINTSEVKEYWDAPLLARAFGRLSESETTEVYGMEDEYDDERTEYYRNQEEQERRAAERAKYGNNQFEINRANNAKDQQAAKDGKKPAANVGLKTSLVKTAPVIQLYLPPSLVFNDDISYNNVDLGAGGLTAMGALNAGAGLVSAVARGVFEGFENIFNLAKGSITQEAAQVAAARISQKLPSVGLRAAAATALQTGLNPGTRVVFDRPQVRQFTFTFRFIATSAQEAAHVEAIIKAFREEMYPETLDLVSGVPAGYRFPNLFQVYFQFRGSKARFPKMQLSYLRGCQVNYNPNSQSFHADGHATEIDMTLTFQEYKALSKQDIQRGY